MRLPPFVLLALLAAPLVAAQPTAPQRDWMVHMDRSTGEWRYVPSEIVLVPGGLVQLMVFGDGRFSLTLDEPGYDADITTETGSVRTAEFAAPATPGRYPFHDKYHPGATGILVVQAAAPAAEIGVVPGGYEARFAPDRLEVDPGQEIVFRANGTFGHNLQARDGSFSAGDLGPGQSSTFRAPAAPGEHAFECRFHKGQGMVGTLVVRESPSASPGPARATSPGDEASPAPSSRSETPGFPTSILVSLLLLLALALRRR